LIVDELGYLPCDSRSADLLCNIVSRRHETRSVVISTNLPFKQWGTVFPGAACVTADAGARQRLMNGDRRPFSSPSPDSRASEM